MSTQNEGGDDHPDDGSGNIQINETAVNTLFRDSDDEAEDASEHAASDDNQDTPATGKSDQITLSLVMNESDGDDGTKKEGFVGANNLSTDIRPAPPSTTITGVDNESDVDDDNENGESHASRRSQRMSIWEVQGLQSKLNEVKIFSNRQLYKGNEEFIKQRLMGKQDEDGVNLPIHIVLQYHLPNEEAEADKVLRILSLTRDEVLQEMQSWDHHSKEEQHALRRQYFEQELTMEYLHASIEHVNKELEMDNISDDDREALEQKLSTYEHLLETRALILEREYALTGEEDAYVFTKIHIPFRVLLKEAEKSRLKLPIDSRRVGVAVGRRRVSKGTSFYVNTLSSLAGNYATVDDTEFNLEFKVNFFSRFLNSDDPENFFTQAQVFYLAKRILERRRYGPTTSQRPSHTRAGVQKLMHKGTYKRCFPLHDSDVHGSKAERQEGILSGLNDTWVAWKKCFSIQPLDTIRSYFGERISFYFLFLAFYTRWLVVPAIVGVVIFFMGFTIQDSADIQELCSSNRTMCPTCASCSLWTLSDACDAYKVSYLIDNHLTVGYSFFMCVWATLFLEFWKRRQSRAAWHWGVNHIIHSEPQRPEFEGKQAYDDVTGVLQKFFPEYLRRRRYFITFLTVAMMLMIIVVVVLGLVILRVIIRERLYNLSSSSNQLNELYVTAISSSLLVVIIVSFNFFYNYIAVKLTNWENHEKQSDYENSLATKVFLFQFVNNYASLFYVAFGKASFSSRPGEAPSIFGTQPDLCSEYGCLIEVTIVLAIIMVGRQAFDNVREVFLPEINGLINRKREAYVVVDNEQNPPWVREATLPAPGALGLFKEYWELLVQFGFITIFINAFPLGPLFALVNNVFERRVDSLKQVKIYRRQFPYVSSNIGVWEDFLKYVGTIAVVANGFIIAVTSNYVPRLLFSEMNGTLVGYIDARYSFSSADQCYYRGFDDDGEDTPLQYQVLMARLAFVIVFEHAVFLIKYLVAELIGDVPYDVIKKERTEDYIIQRIIDRSLETETAEYTPDAFA